MAEHKYLLQQGAFKQFVFLSAGCFSVQIPFVPSDVLLLDAIWQPPFFSTAVRNFFGMFSCQISFSYTGPNLPSFPAAQQVEPWVIKDSFKPM